jgi:hypothetical protein
VAGTIAQLSLTSKNKSHYTNIISFLKKLQAVRHVSHFFPLIEVGNIISFLKKLQAVRHVSHFFPLIEVGPMSPKSRFFNKHTVTSRTAHSVR